MDTLVEIREEGRVATLVLHRPEKRNALDHALVAHLKDALQAAAAREDIRVVVLTGAGPVFSAGADLAALERLQQATAEQNAADSAHLAGLYEQIYLHPKPVIAMVNGHAIAGGCGLAAVCDFAIASAEAKLGFTEVRIGFVPAIVSVFVMRKLGEAAARDLLLRGRLVTAQEAVAMGLINRAVAAEALDSTVQELAHELSYETSGTAVALTKQLLAAVPGMGLHEALVHASQMNAFARGTEDCRAGVAAFLKKSAPPWKEGGD
jgi:methylglutaconyl-CoA hydratase